jgi:hypothetical protein
VRYEEVSDAIRLSGAEDWNKITAWGGGGPSFPYGYPDEQGNWTSYEELAAYKGLTSQSDWRGVSST